MARFPLFIISIMLVLGCSQATAQGERMVESGTYNTLLKTLLSHSVPEMSVDSLFLLHGQVTLLDAREQAEFDVSHFANATHVGYEAYDSTAVADIDKNTPIVVYCSIGYRSEKIAERLIADGFTNVSNLYGGIFEWVNQAGDIVNDSGPTQRVHAYSRSWGVWLSEGEKVFDKDLE